MTLTTEVPKDGAASPDPTIGRVIESFGLIGNLHTAALISRFGSVDWACFPRFASPSVFARLLDEQVGGFQSIAPVEGGGGSQRYIPDTNILQTRFELDSGRQLLLTDFMPVPPHRSADGAAMIVRIAEAVGGEVSIRWVIDPRFEYGKHPAQWSSEDPQRWTAAHPPEALVADLPHPARLEGGQVVGEATALPGDPLSFEFVWGDRRPTALTPIELLDQTRGFWRRWVHSREAPLERIAREWREAITRSELVLKLLSQSETGAFVAAPTTSLPEWPGGTRNWDYRYVWIRDAAFTAEALVLLGHLPEARAFLRWVIERIQGGNGSDFLRVVYGAHGETDLSEHTVYRLSGFLDSRPVRIGNGAAEQFQLDIYGEVLDCAVVLGRFDPEFVRVRLPTLLRLAETVLQRKEEPDRGIWEIRGPPQRYVHSQVMAWVGLDRAATLAGRFGGRHAADRWVDAASSLREEILEKGFDAERGSFVQSFGSRALDAANLRIPLVGFLPYDDPRVLGTIHAVERELARGPFVYRYRADDGIAGEEGSFLPCGFWRIECLAHSGRREEARRDFRQLLSVASPTGLLAEEYDPASRRLLGNYPQAFSHIALLRAARALGVTAPEQVRRPDRSPTWPRVPG